LEPEREPPTAAQPIEVTTRGHFVALLDRLGLSLALTARPNRIVFLGAVDRELTVHAPMISRPMGLAANPKRLAVASVRSIIVFANAPRLAAQHPGKPGFYDAFFVPRIMHFTGECLMHDMVFSGNAVIGANTKYSCVCRVDGSFSFTPLWKPPFITELRPQDRCHLNGFAGQDGRLRYVTALAATDTEGGWRGQSDFSGVLIDVEENKVLRSDLCMPHSPRLVGDELYLLNAGKGEVLRVDRVSGESTLLTTLPGFAHGLCEHAGVLFVGLSQNRVTRKENPPPIAQQGNPLIAGVAAIESKTGQLLGTAEFSGITEVYDVQALPGIRRAGMHSLLADDGFVSVDTPHSEFWLKREGSEMSHLLDAAASGNYVIRVGQ
jgi:uncharacterized protein (TIGR03032 family)